MSDSRPLVVFDLDGTLADDSHRLPLILQTDPADRTWPAYFAACSDDPPIAPTITILQHFYYEGYRVEIWTGRSETVRRETTRWLWGHNAYSHLLRMRPADDFRPNLELKAEWLAASDRLPVMVFEDQAKYVSWWLAQGLPVFQVHAIRSHQVADDGAEVRLQG